MKITHNLALLANTPVQAKCLLHNLVQGAGSVGFYMKTNKTEFMSFRQEGAISTESGKLLKLIGQSTYFSSNISSIESDVNIPLAKA